MISADVMRIKLEKRTPSLEVSYMKRIPNGNYSKEFREQPVKPVTEGERKPVRSGG